MTLVLTLESAPHAQPVRQIRLEDGERIIGRGQEADWRLADPDNFISRRHCIVAGRDGRFTVMDTSSGGLFIDEAPRPLGAGATVELRDGMQLRLGDCVLRVAIERQACQTAQPFAPQPAAARPAAQPTDLWPTARPDPFDQDAFFEAEPSPTPIPPRPADLPPRFEEAGGQSLPAPERLGPPAFDDPLTLDPQSVRRRDIPEAAQPGAFDWDAEPEPRPVRVRERAPAPEPPAAPVRSPVRAAASDNADDDAGLSAFMRGLGLEPSDLPEGDSQARLQALGREYRQMAEGLMLLLRMRAREKGDARIARTEIGAAENNPLKLMPTVEDALAAMLAPRGPGFSNAERSIGGAIRDLGQHQVGAWRGVQTALRRMIDRFDPKLVEAEVERLGLLETMLSGGRKAKLWEIYERRFAETARSAETRFLGEVGADFREAYENEERKP